ncbi:DUF1566 domain-containing protein [Desulfobacter latus]|uniref:DUF1566 domain-containing protein n=1 Tax=Desulfobacter latus TaxID=2292 RepID=A0A850TD10_9BACT|nr:DUF1566 domain-containing protein [Desulfobacter latus]NWH05296.1 DUF1566 domain-containing protein [Desulfobacter latus]
MKKIFLCSVLFLLLMSGMSQAEMITIGTATYNGNDYNLIWDDDNNGNSVVWLDYSNYVNWASQVTWTNSLDSALTYNIDAQYSVTWDDAAWRLPSTVDGGWDVGYEGDPDNDGNYTYTGGYNLANSEMGHLYYEELGNLGYIDTSGNYPQPGWGLTETGDFKNLIASRYWSGTEYANMPSSAWYFRMENGAQSTNNKHYDAYVLAVRSGQVSASSAPVPGTALLLGAGLLGLAAAGRKKGRGV